MHNSASFLRLVALRGKVRFTLAFLVLVAHAFFVGGIAFYRDWFARPFSEGGTVTIGIVVTVGVIVAMIVLEWVYIFISDKWLMPMQEDVLQEGTQEETKESVET